MRKITYFKMILLFTILAVGSVAVSAQIAGWDFSLQPGGSGNYGTSPLAATTSNPNVTVGGLTRGSGFTLTNNGAGKAWGATGFTASGTLTGEISANKYYTFSITPKTGYQVSVTGIAAYNIRRSSTGPTTGQWQYQIGSGSFVNIGSAITWGPGIASSGNTQLAIDFSGITDLQNVASNTITFRLVNYGATAAGGTNYFNDLVNTTGNDLIINGTVIIPITSNVAASTFPDCPSCDLTVGAGGTLTVDAPKTFNTVTVEGGGKLNTLPGKPLTAGTVILKAGKDGTSFSSKLEADITAGTVRFLKTVDDAKWYFLSFPCDVAVACITRSDGGSLGTLGTDWFIKYYDGLQRATIGVVDGTPNWKLFTGTTLTAGQGYIVGLKTGVPETEILFPLTTDVVKTESAKTIPVSSYAGAGGAPNNSGWNLVGQPYLSKYAAQGSSNAPYMVLSDGISTYSVYSNASDQLPTINPFDAYFVQADAALESSALTFDLGGRQNVPVSVASSTSESVQLKVTTSTGADNTCLILDNEQSTGYQIGRDMEKWIGTGTDKPQIYTVLGGINYAFNALPVNSVINLPVGFYSKTTGPATISVNASKAPGLSSLMLTDITTGTTTNLLTSDYTFTGTAGTDNARFVITAQRVATGNTAQTEQGGPTVLSTDAGLILNNLTANSTVRMYDAFGRMVVTKVANNNSLELPLLPVGVYVIQIKSNTKNWVIKFVNKR